MKTIYVESKDIQIGDNVFGTINNIVISGHVQIYSSKMNVWVNVNSNTGTIASKSMDIDCPTTGVSWDAIESFVLSELGLVKSANQEIPSPMA